MSTVTSLGFSIFSRYDGSGVNRARRDINSLNGDVQRNNKALDRSSVSFRGLITAAAALGPALIPIGAVLTGVTAATASLGATGGAALGVYGGAMKFAIQRTFEMRDAGKALGPSQTLFVSRTDAMNAAWIRFIRATEPLTLATAGVAVQGITAAIGRLAPIVRAVHPILFSIAQDFRAWASGDGLARFIAIVKKDGVPALAGLVRAGRDVVTVLGIGFRATVPLIAPLVRWIEKGAAALKRWAEGGGFTRFVANVQAMGPSVGEFFKQLGASMVKLGQAMAGLGPLSLSLATVMLRLTAALPVGVVQALVVAYVLYRPACLLATAATWLMASSNIALAQGLVISRAGALLMVGAAIAQAVASGVATVATAAWAAVTWLLTAALAVLLSPIFLVIAAVAALGFVVFLLVNHWSAAWNAIKNTAATIWAFLRSRWGFLIATIGPIGWLLLLLAHWRAVWGALKVAAFAIWGALKSAWRGTCNFLFAVWRGAWGAIRNVGVAVWHGLVSAGRAIWGAMGAVFRGTLNGMRSFWGGAWRAMSAVGRAIWGGMRNALRAVLNAMVSAFHAAVNGIRIAWNKLRGVVAAPVKFFVNTVYNNGLRRAWNSTAGKIPGVPDLPAAKIGFAAGGPVWGPGGPKQDKIHAMLSAGEYVINADAVKQIGVQNLDALNGRKPQGKRPNFGKEGGSPGQPGYFLGGLIPNPIDWIKKGIHAVAKFLGVDGVLDWAVGVFRDIGSLALKATLSPVYSLIGSIAKDKPSGVVGDGVAANGKRGLDALINFAIGKMPEGGGGNFPAGLAWAKTQVGKKYQWGGNGNPSWDCSGFMSAIESVIRGEKPHRRWATGAFGGKGPSGWKRNANSAFMIGITNAGVGHTAGTLLGTNVECRGGAGCLVGKSARGYNDRMFTSRWGFTAGGGGASGPAQKIAQAMLGRFGWGQDQFGPLKALWQRESGWNPFAKNPSSGAYGIPQALPASKMASAGGDWRTNAATQIKWGLGYIKGRYGSPAAANAFQRAHNFYSGGGYVTSYDNGGYLPKGLSLAYNGTGGLERVGGGDNYHFHFSGPVASERAAEDMVVKAMQNAKRKNRLPK